MAYQLSKTLISMNINWDSTNGSLKLNMQATGFSFSTLSLTLRHINSYIQICVWVFIWLTWLYMYVRHYVFETFINKATWHSLWGGIIWHHQFQIISNNFGILYKYYNFGMKYCRKIYLPFFKFLTRNLFKVKNWRKTLLFFINDN